MATDTLKLLVAIFIGIVTQSVICLTPSALNHGLGGPTTRITVNGGDERKVLREGRVRSNPLIDATHFQQQHF